MTISEETVKNEIVKTEEAGCGEEGASAEDAVEKKTAVKQFLEDERGIGVIEIILILVILIGLVLLFKDQITSIVNSAFGKITSDATTILK